MPERSSKRPRDLNQLAAKITEIATEGEMLEPITPEQAAARLLGSKGGKRGGPARANKLTSERRVEIAREAARSRWKAKTNK
jgi:hypothetical protein